MRILGPKLDEVAENFVMRNFTTSYSSPNTTGVTNSRNMGMNKSCSTPGEIQKNTKIPFVKRRSKWEITSELNLKQTRCGLDLSG